MLKQFIVYMLLFQIVMIPMALAIEPVIKDPNSAAFKSTVLPGWGQYENGESEKGYGIRINMGD